MCSLIEVRSRGLNSCMMILSCPDLYSLPTSEARQLIILGWLRGIIFISGLRILYGYRKRWEQQGGVGASICCFLMSWEAAKIITSGTISATDPHSTRLGSSARMLLQWLSIHPTRVLRQPSRTVLKAARSQRMEGFNSPGEDRSWRPAGNTELGTNRCFAVFGATGGGRKGCAPPSRVNDLSLPFEGT